ncbi:MAG: peptide deformylase [Geminicoccaceae bacterium]|jgi:peptide deformylase|nr:MAG: peptide deformylase [Geminicoccaceae bacterium]
MAVRRILIAPHPLLKLKARPVERVDDEIRRLMDDMLETMYRAPGIGLAAPQIGVSLRVVVVDLAKKDEPPAPMRLVNPEITWRSEEQVVMEEGCLSLPEQFAEVTRPAAVKVRYLDERGEEREVEADGMLARCLQHEVDHLDGILFVDRLSPLKRNMIMRKLAKSQRARA